MIIGLTHALVICRVVTAILLAKSKSPFLRDHSTTIAMLSGAVLHYITIQVMTRVSRLLVDKLSNEKRNCLDENNRFVYFRSTKLWPSNCVSLVGIKCCQYEINSINKLRAVTTRHWGGQVPPIIRNCQMSPLIFEILALICCPPLHSALVRMIKKL